MFDVFYSGPKPDLFVFEKPAASITEADARSSTKYFWYVNGHNDYTDFNFNWRPVPWEADHTQVWSSQWQENGGTYLVPKGTVNHKWHWRTDDQLVPRRGNPEIFYMDFMNPESKLQFETLREKYPNIKSTRYVSDHLNVLKRIVNLATTEYVWVISSICDYHSFDFTWHPGQWQTEMIHCFASGNQKRGDTFYIHVPSFKQQMYNLELLDWFNVINYLEHVSVPRFDMPIHNYDTDDLVSEIRQYQFTTPYALFSNQPDCYPRFDPCLWREKDRAIEGFTPSNAICAVPRDIKLYLNTQVYDYPYVLKDHSRYYFLETQLDIVYISNGEPNEQEYYDWLTNNTSARDYSGKIHWVRGVNGRTQAYQEAASRSSTPWFFTVFAKLRVDPNFDFNWKPDYFQQPKHYIFHAKNPVNDLEYGHMGMIAYNKMLTLNTQETGLDFTLSAAHEVVPVHSGVAEYNQDSWVTWRTAFREVLKLKHFTSLNLDIQAKHRLNRWLTVAQGDFAEWSIHGATDAVEYYDSVAGDFAKLKLSYEWSWLSQYYNSKYQ